MRKILLSLSILFCFAASAQYQNINRPLQYVNTFGYQYERFHAMYLMGLPNDTVAVPALLQNVPFIANKSGSLYLWNTSTLVWDLFSSGGSSTQTLQQVFNTEVGGSLLTKNDSIIFNGNRSLLQFGQQPDPWTHQLGEGLLNLVTIDTIKNPDTERAWGFNSHTIFRSPSYASSIYRLGNNLQVTYENADSVRLNSFGGDFGSAVRANFHFKRVSGYTGRSVYVIGAQTMTDHIPIDISNLDWGDETDVAGTNYKYVKGFIAGKSSYLIMRAADTLTNWMGFNNWGFLPGGYVNWSADYVGGYLGNISTARVGKHWYLYNHGALSPSWLKSALYIGDSTLTSAALLNVSSTTKGVVFPRMTGAQMNAISSPLAGLMIYNTDSSAYCFYNGSAWTKMGTGSGGGGGMTNPMTTEGDLIVGGVSGTPTRVAAGTANYILTSNGPGVAPSWQANTGSGGGDVSKGLIQNATYTLTSTPSAQKIFNVDAGAGAGAIAVDANTTYLFECIFALKSMSGTNGNCGFDVLGAGTATLTSVNWVVNSRDVTLNSASAGSNLYSENAAITANIAQASTATEFFAHIKGTIRVNAGGTIIPSTNLTTAAAAVVQPNSYFKLTPIGNSSVTSW